MRAIFLRIRAPRYSVGLLLMLVVVLLHVTLGMLTDVPYLDGIRVDHIAVTEWIGFDLHNSYITVFTFLLPIAVMLSPATTITEDIRSGAWMYLAKPSRRQYLIRHLVVSFISGFCIAAIPLAVDAAFAYLLFPNVTPNLITNYNEVVASTVTYWSQWYYTQPVRLIVTYIIFIGGFGGLFALLGSALGIATRRRVVALMSPFVAVLALTIGTSIFPQFISSPVFVLSPLSPAYLPTLWSVFVTYGITLVCAIGGILFASKHQTEL